MIKLREVSAVQAAVLDGLGDVGGEDRAPLGEIGNGARDLQDSVIRPGREAQLVHRKLDEPFGIRINRAVLLEVLWLQLGVAVDSVFLVSLHLNLSSLADSPPDRG